MNVSVLFVAKNSVYKTLGVDCWDEERDALKWPGGNPIVAHPPCRLFCRLSHMSSAPESEKQLAYWSVDQIRKWGGVIEHPARSKLWREYGLPYPGTRDSLGFSIVVDQWWWGHRAQKPTWLYIYGLNRDELPESPWLLGYPDATCSTRTWRDPRRVRNKELSATPPEFACWLIAVAERCKV